MGRNTASWLLLATLLACEPAPEPEADAADTSAVTSVAQTRFFPARPVSDLPQAATTRIEASRTRAEGIVFVQREGAVASELTVLNDTSYEVQTIARLRLYDMPAGGFTDTLWVRRRELITGVQRLANGQYGMRATSVQGTWARVTFAYDSTGTAQQGWVRLDPARVNFVRGLP